MAGGGRVDQDEVSRLGPLQALHLPEDEDVAHAGDGGRDDVERAGAHEPA